MISEYVKDGVIPLKVNSLEELKQALDNTEVSESISQTNAIDSQFAGSCDYKETFSRGLATLGILVTTNYDVKNPECVGPHPANDWYFTSANGHTDLVGLSANLRFDDSNTDCSFNSDSPELQITSSGTLVTYLSIAGQEIASRDPILHVSKFYAYNH